MDNLYEILNINFSANNFSIAYNYRKQMLKIINSANINQDVLIKIHKAYFILSNEQGRKYYDLLLNSEINQKGIKLNESTIYKYEIILNELSEEGENNIKVYLEDIDELKRSDFRRPLFLVFLQKGLFFNIGGANLLTYTGFGGFVFCFLGISVFIRFFLNFDKRYLAAAIFISLMGLIILISSYRKFITEYMKLIFIP